MAQTDAFDQPVSREDTCAVKLDARNAVFGRDDVLPLWVADMDFPAPPAVTEALVNRARHPVYGYTLFPESLYQSLIDWFERRHGWSIERESLMLAPGVVPSLHALALALAGEGEGIIIQPPVYPPFREAVRKTGRRLVENPLQEVAGEYRMDLVHLEQCAAEGARVLLLCSPHNPVGRVWRAEELAAVLDIARRYGLKVVSDDIHCDLIYPDSGPLTLTGSLPGADACVITAVAPSKTFNIPGLGLSALVVPRREDRQAIRREFDRLHMGHCHPFSIVAFEAAYRHGEPWLDALLPRLQANRDYVAGFVQQNLPQIRVIPAQGTYLLWLDCRSLGLDDPQLKQFFVHQAGLGLNPGSSFGTGGSGFMRLNIGTSRTILEQALGQLHDALQRCFGPD